MEVKRKEKEEDKKVKKKIFFTERKREGKKQEMAECFGRFGKNIWKIYMTHGERGHF